MYRSMLLPGVQHSLLVFQNFGCATLLSWQVCPELIGHTRQQCAAISDYSYHPVRRISSPDIIIAAVFNAAW